MTNRKQMMWLVLFLIVYALCAFVTYTFFMKEMAASAGATVPDMGVSPFVLGLANAGIVLVLYGLLGLGGYWFARKVGLPGIYSPDGNWRRWVFIPLGIGVACGLVLIVGDRLFAPINGFGYFVHPTFPVSILATVSAGIGEEIAFRGFVFGLWSLILTWIFRRWNGQKVALWISNFIAALAFGAGHLGTVMYLAKATSLSQLSPVLLVEVFVLNGLIGLLAGYRYMKDGLVAAAGVHFWTDMVWHVFWPLLG